MPRYAVSKIDWNDNELTTEIVEASDMFDAIKKSPKAFAQVEHVFTDQEHEFFTEPEPSERLSILKQEAFNADGMINVVEIPDNSPI